MNDEIKSGIDKLLEDQSKLTGAPMFWKGGYTFKTQRLSDNRIELLALCEDESWAHYAYFDDEGIREFMFGKPITDDDIRRKEIYG